MALVFNIFVTFIFPIPAQDLLATWSPSLFRKDSNACFNASWKSWQAIREFQSVFGWSNLRYFELCVLKSPQILCFDEQESLSKPVYRRGPCTEPPILRTELSIFHQISRFVCQHQNVHLIPTHMYLDSSLLLEVSKKFGSWCSTRASWKLMPINSNLGGVVDCRSLPIEKCWQKRKNNSPIHALLSLKDSLTNLSNLRAFELPWVILDVFVVASEVGFLAVLISMACVNGIPALCLTQISGTYRGAQKKPYPQVPR